MFIPTGKLNVVPGLSKLKNKIKLPTKTNKLQRQVTNAYTNLKKLAQ